jgi:hypothetical protein
LLIPPPQQRLVRAIPHPWTQRTSVRYDNAGWGRAGAGIMQRAKFMLRTISTAEQASASRAIAVRRHMTSVLWVSLGVAVISSVAAGGVYWSFNREPTRVSAELAAPSKDPGNDALTNPEVGKKPSSSELATEVAQPVELRPLEPAEPAAAPAPVTALEAQTASSVAPPASEPPATKPAPGPHDDVYRVRFDSKVPGLTPTGLRALNAALRALDAGREVRIAIEGCEDGDVPPTSADCAALTRRLKSILVDRGVQHPTALIAASH